MKFFPLWELSGNMIFMHRKVYDLILLKVKVTTITAKL